MCKFISIVLAMALVLVMGCSEEDEEIELSLDDTKIAFMSEREGGWNIYVMNIDGTDQINLTNSSEPEESPSWSPFLPVTLSPQ